MATKTKVKGIMESDELRVHDVARLMEHFVKLIEDTPDAIFRSADDAGREAERAVDAAKEAVRKVHGFIDELEREEERLLDRYDELYRNVQKKRVETAQKLDDLPPAWKMKDLEQLVETAERLARLTDDEWERVVELAKTMKG